MGAALCISGCLQHRRSYLVHTSNLPGWEPLLYNVVVQSLSLVQLSDNQVPLSIEFSRQEYWSMLPFASLGDLPDPGIEPMSPALAGRFFTAEPPGNPH